MCSNAFNTVCFSDKPETATCSRCSARASPAGGLTDTIEFNGAAGTCRQCCNKHAVLPLWSTLRPALSIMPHCYRSVHQPLAVYKRNTTPTAASKCFGVVHAKHCISVRDSDSPPWQLGMLQPHHAPLLCSCAQDMCRPVLLATW